MAVGVGETAGAGLLGCCGVSKSDAKKLNRPAIAPSARSTPHRHNNLPVVFAQVGMEYGHSTAARASTSARISEKTQRPIAADPLRRSQKQLPRRDQERRDDRLSEHAVYVLRQL